MAFVRGAPAWPVVPSVSFGQLEDLPHLDAERGGDALLRRHPRAATASFQVGDVRGLEVSGIGEVFLRPAPFLTKRSHGRSERSSQIAHSTVERRERGFLLLLH